ncbi:MAG: flavodoxin family protein [Peptostreptococcales bacterium]
MKICILMGSPHKDGNTAKLLRQVLDELQNNQIQYETIWLYDQHIEPCRGCLTCRKTLRCQFDDDMYSICEKIFDSDTVIIATPIYSWYCTAPVKALLDRLVYGKKQFESEKGVTLWTEKNIALVLTCGARPEKGTDLLEEGMKRYFSYSKAKYVGKLVQRDDGPKVEFLTDECKRHAKLFAHQLIDPRE